MPEYDGTYTLGVEIDTTQAKKDLDNLAKDTTKALNKDNNVITPKVDVNKLKAQLKNAKSEYDKLVSDIKENPIYSIDEKDAENYLKLAREELGRITKSSSYANNSLSAEDTKRAEALKEYIGYVNDWNRLSKQIKDKEEEIESITSAIAQNEKKAEESREKVVTSPAQSVKDVSLNPQAAFGNTAIRMQQAQQKTTDQIKKQIDALKTLDIAYKSTSQKAQASLQAQEDKVKELNKQIAMLFSDDYSNEDVLPDLSKTYKKVQDELDKTNEKYQMLRARATSIEKELANTPMGKSESKAQEKLKVELDKINSTLPELYSKSSKLASQLNKWDLNPKLLPEVNALMQKTDEETKKLQTMKSEVAKKESDYQAKRGSIKDTISSLQDTLNAQKGEAALKGENTLIGQLLGLIKDFDKQGVKGVLDGISTALVALPEPITTTIGLIMKVAGVLGIVTAALNVIKKILDGIFGIIKKVFSTVLKLAQTALNKLIAKFKELTKRTNVFGNIFQRMFRKISTSLKRRLFYGVITRGIGNLRNALVNLIKTDEEVKKSIGQLKGNLMTAFAPVYSFILPAIQRLMNALVQLSALLARITSGLFGKTTKQSAELAKSLEEQAKAGNSASQSLAGFDKLNTISTGSGGDSIKPIYDLMDDLFKNSQLEQYVRRLRRILSNLWEPFARSWEKYGKPTLDKAKETFETALNLILKIGETFSEVWNGKKYIGANGDSILGHLWTSLQNILDCVKNLLESLGEAWDVYGEPIAKGILKVVENIAKHFENITSKFKKWSKNINFKPLLSGINDIVDALDPLSDTIGEGLEQFADDVLFPLGQWLIEKAIPKVLETVADLIRRISSNLDGFNLAMSRIWDKYLKKFAEDTGDLILDCLTDIDDTLKTLNGDVDSSRITFALLSGVIEGVITGIKTLKDLLIGFIGGPLVLLIVQHLPSLYDIIKWIVHTIDDLIIIMHNIPSKISEVTGKIRTKLAEWVQVFTVTKDSLKWCVDDMCNKIANALSQVKSWVHDLYTNIITWINGIIDAIGRIISRIADGISQFGSFGHSASQVLQQLGETVQAIELVVPQPSTPSVSGHAKNKIKGHATGNVIPPNVAPYLAILGDNNKETEIVSPLSTMKQAMMEAMSEGGFGGSGTMHIHIDVDGREIANAVVNQNEMYKKRTGRSLLV